MFAHPRGKQLGGSSAINFLWWTHASRRDIDNWGALGNANWSWDALEPYFRRSEHYIAPSPGTEAALGTGYIDPALHGTDGPVENTFADIYGPFDEAWPRTYDTLGLGVSSDLRDGLALGGYTNLINMDPSTRSRSYAATAYWRPARDRQNLRTITGAHASRVLFEHVEELPVAKGVNYSSNGTVYSIFATKEVVLCAGAFGSPKLLELSGIGDEALLRRFGIEQVVGNDNVGENLQDHAYVPVGYEVREPGFFTLDDLANATLFEEAYDQYIVNRTGLLATTSASSALLSLAQIENATYNAQLRGY